MSNNIDKKVVNDAMENGSGNCGTGLSDEKVSVLNVLPVQKFVSFSQRTEPCSTKCEEVLTVDENVEPEHDIHAKLEIKDVDKTGDDRGNCMFSSGMVEKQSDYYTTKVDDSEKDNESKVMRHEEETMKSSSVSNMKEDGCDNFKYLKIKLVSRSTSVTLRGSLAVKRSTRRTTSRLCFVPSTPT